jgi:hypothetical protein
MLAYDIVEETGGEAVVLASFSAPWAASVPIFNAAARAYFAALAAGPGRVLFLYATLEDDNEPVRTALVCSAHRVGDAAEWGVEIRAGPLLDAAFKSRRH